MHKPEWREIYAFPRKHVAAHVFTAACRTRTYNLLITNQLHYHCAKAAKKQDANCLSPAITGMSLIQ